MSNNKKPITNPIITGHDSDQPMVGSTHCNIMIYVNQTNGKSNIIDLLILPRASPVQNT